MNSTQTVDLHDVDAPSVFLLPVHASGGRAAPSLSLPNRPPFSSPAIVNRCFRFPVDDTGDENGLRFPAVFPFSLSIRQSG